MLRSYPYFYTYIGTSFVVTAISYFVLLEYPASYATVFWPFEFLSLFVGCGLVLEIFGHVLDAYPGADKVAKALCAIVFAILFLVGLFYLFGSSSAALANSEVELERNVRAAQILFFLGIVGTIFYYGIALGRNMRGMIYGYGVYLAASVISLALRLYYHARVDALRTFRPIAFDLSLLTWLIALWSYEPNPAPPVDPPDEPGYEALASLTKAQIEAMRSHIGRPTRG
ncbi:MAG: hypothetical protein ACRD40_02095 [Candidatus Acidiferrales bacterium]